MAQVNGIRFIEINGYRIPVLDDLLKYLGGGGDAAYWGQLPKALNDPRTIEAFLEDNYATLAGLVEIDEELHDLIDEVAEITSELTSIAQKVERALLLPVPQVTSTELVGIGATNNKKKKANGNEQLRIKLGSGLVYDPVTQTLSVQGGGGSAEPVFVIHGTAEIDDPSDLMEVPITISGTNPFGDLQTFFNANNRLPRIILNLEIVFEETTISDIYLDMYANTITSTEIGLVGSNNDLSSSGISTSYTSIALTSTQQYGSLSSVPLQTRLNSDSEFSARKINIGRYFVTESVMQALNNVLTQFPNKQNQLTAGANITIDASDPDHPVISAVGGSGGNVLYRHSVSFNTSDDDMHWQIEADTISPNRYTSLDQFWNDIRKINTIFGTPNLSSITKKIYFNGAMAENDTIFVRGVDSDFDVVTKDISKISVDESSFGDYGVQSLNASSLKTKKRK